VRDPARTIPRAVVTALGVAAVVYAAVAVALLAVLEPAQLARSTAPLVDAVEAGSLDALAPVVRVGAAAGALGALLGLLAGVARTLLAMSRGDDLPGWLGRVSPRTSVPHAAEVALAVAVSALVLTVDLRGALGFSAFGVLLYYLVANLAALTQTAEHRRFPRALPVVGAGGCAVLIATLPPASVLAGLAVLAVGVVVRVLRLRGALAGGSS
jgi:APA family basic amino acid/polyamine antiporter